MDVRTREFPEAHRRALDNASVRGATMRATESFNLRREQAYAELGEDLEPLKQRAADVKDHTLEHLDHYLALLADNVEARGGRVHFALDAAEARDAIVGIARAASARLAVKSKSMVTEEIELNAALEAAGVETVESDLGEFILQLEGEHPSHIVGPAIHKPKSEVDALFHRLYGTPETATVDELAAQARAVIRDKFLRADLGISGVNFAVAETGSVVVVENEGNARLSTSVPRVHVAVMGLEKVIPRLEDLGVFLRLLPRAATGQRTTVYTSVITGPRQLGEPDGPDEFHLVILDNGRSGVLADPELRASLRCIRCGACLNTCPVYQQVGGHAYGWVYSGPIGSVLDPSLLGLEEAGSLPFASSLCGACGDVCPVGIPLPQMLVTQRTRAVERGLPGPVEAGAMRAFAAAVTRPAAYRILGKAARLVPFARGKLPRVPLGPLGAWQRDRDFPAPARRSFRELWAAGLDREPARNLDREPARDLGDEDERA